MCLLELKKSNASIKFIAYIGLGILFLESLAANGREAKCIKEPILIAESPELSA